MALSPTTPLFMTGARAKLHVNGVVVAFATNVSYRISIPHAPVTVMGRYSAAGHEPLGLDVSVSCGTLRSPKPNTAPGDGSASDLGLGAMPALQGIFDSPSFQISIEDRKTGATILTVQDCRQVDRSGGGSARDMFSETWDFVGTIPSDEVVTQVEDSTAVDPYHP